MKNKNQLIDTFVDIVGIDSPSGHEEKISAYLVNRMKSLGGNCRVDDTGNIITIFPGVGEPILLCAHLDTVEPGVEIQPCIRDGIIRSTNSTVLGADNKAAVASIIMAIQESSEHNRRSLEVIFSVREETDGGINHLDLSSIKSRVGIVADSVAPIGTIITASPWIEDLVVVWFTLPN